jgi:acetyl-CoA carboxylase biotin carboxylase subunit
VTKQKLLIANRGEIAVRIIRTCREMGITSVAIYSDADRDALHVELGDVGYGVGPALAGYSYLSMGAFLVAARKAMATVVNRG